jgi:hypothetical protein
VRKVVYTAIYGGSDELKPLPRGTAGVAFTDDPTLGDEPRGWEVIVDRLVHLGHPRLRAKYVKVHPHVVLPDADVTLWLDGSMELKPGWTTLLDSLSHWDAVFFRHHARDCIYEEVAASRGGRPAIYAGQPLEAQVQHYAEMPYGIEPHGGLFASGCMLRRNNEFVEAFGEKWWHEICRWSIQDQLSMPLAARMCRWTTFEWTMLEQPWFGIAEHARDNPSELP